MEKVLALAPLLAGVLFGWTAFSPTKAIAENREEVQTTQWDDYQKWYHLTKGRPITGDPTGFPGSKDGEKGYREVYVNHVGEAGSKGKAPYY